VSLLLSLFQRVHADRTLLQAGLSCAFVQAQESVPPIDHWCCGLDPHILPENTVRVQSELQVTPAQH
jgi:hypothetical protein